MGDHDSWGRPSRILPNGLLPGEVAGVTQVLNSERWSIVEARTAELIECIQPNQSSEERRNAVANYVQQLIMKCFSCQVFTFGSVPLKTYLPDGDIDMTAFSTNLNLKDTWASEVRSMLENEEKSETAEFRVKEVQYIQAEVKIIKCLVENIVVDISFNQLGGLCTLCFLEEIDNLIERDHLFKHSIILIKAWCYYESRILGAHHGLISTYALETLVLYIFHIFNNSFSGPLEVLYRFLEFFSNFDWDNFCLSLWGPIPISSLPNMAAEPPRKDSGELLLGKLFLDTCSSRYAVEENQGQPFVSKFFNIIDPLRTNNNLGRSVSKGNFYRIRSAFAFGAKSLAWLLECPKDDLIAEVNKFFANTWQRHQSGHRPDAPSPLTLHLQPLNTHSAQVSENSVKHRVSKRSETVSSPAGDEYLASNGAPLVRVSTTRQPSRGMYSSSSNSSVVSPTQSQKSYGRQSSFGVSEQMERSASTNGSVQADRGQKISRPDYIANDSGGQSRFQFARTHSSPELIDTSTMFSSHGKRNKMPETGKIQFSSARLDHSSTRKNPGSEVLGSHNVRASTNDPSSSRHGFSRQSVDAAPDVNCISNSHHDDSGFTTTEELASVFETLEMHQEEQDMVNMMASSSVQNFNGQVQFPMHLPLPPPMVASIGYSQRNLAGMLPGNIPLIKRPWGSNTEFSQGFASSQLPYYLPSARLGSNSEDMTESGNESSNMSDINQEDVDDGFWHDQDAGSREVLAPDNRKFQMLHPDDKQLSSVGIFNTFPSSRVSNSGGSSIRGQHKHVRENSGLVREDCTDALQYKNSGGQDVYSIDRITNYRPVSTSQSSSSRSKASSESSWDGSSMRMSKAVRDKRGRKTSSAVMPSPYGNSKYGWQYEDSSSVSVDYDNKDWVPLSTLGSNLAERSSESTTLAHPQVHSEQLPNFEQAQMSGSDSLIPISRVLVGAGSRQRTGDNAGMGPLTFYPTGPPVPFLAMLPVYNVPSESGNSDGPTSQFDRDGALENGHLSPFIHNFDSAERFEQPEVESTPGPMKSASPEHSEEHKPDILNSNLASHWQNLQYGRFCQDTQYNGPVVYPSPVMVPPMYLQGHFPFDGPGRPLSANVFSQIMGYGPRLVPITPLQPGHNRPSNLYQYHGGEVPRYRCGTGTYLPNPKVSFRDRQTPSVRNHRGNYSYDRNDHGDREGSWINSKSRAGGRSNSRTQAEKPSSRYDRWSGTEKRADRPWYSNRHDPMPSCQNQNSSFSSTGNVPSSAEMAYSMYSFSAVNSNGLGSGGPSVSPVVMLYPYGPGARYGSSSEQLEFGSLGPVHLSGTSEIPQATDGVSEGPFFDQNQPAYKRGSSHSSPDQPSSPRHHNRLAPQRNYQAKHEDF